MGTLEEGAPPPPLRPSRFWLALGGLLCVLFSVVGVGLARWQSVQQKLQSNFTNLRRIALGAILYAQDWDGRFMPLAHRLEGNRWRTWRNYLEPYVEENYFLSPLNPLLPNSRDPKGRYAITTAYACNYRLWDVFGKGVFPVESLDLPAQTAFFVDAGSVVQDPLRPNSARRPIAQDLYTDTTERLDGYSPYPSSVEGKICVAAIDGHIVTVKVAYYQANAAHDPLVGRLGGNIYNWNGGLVQGASSSPPKE